MKWRAFTHSRRSLGAAFVAVIGFSALTVWFGRGVMSGPEADPGGRILDTLRGAAQALPSDAHVLYWHDFEPKWDSCDGRPGTFGWDNVDVQIHFESRSPTVTVFRRADQTLRGLGWSPDYVNNQSVFIQVGWTRRLDHGAIARAQLSNGVPDQSAATPRWDLFVTAPPVGSQASGC